MQPTQSATALEDGDYVDVAGRRTHYHEAGAGDTVLLIHGSGPGVTAWANWRFTIPELAKTHRVLAPDVLGFGYSARPADARYGRDAWVEHLREFLAVKGVRRASIVGNSMGGALALGLAITAGDLVERLVLMGSVGLSFPITEGLDAVWGYEPSEATMRRLLLEYFAYDSSIVTPELVRLRYEASIQPGFHESYAAMFPAPRQRSLDALAWPLEKIAALDVPTLLIHGRDDKVIPFETSLRLFGMLARAELHGFARCGHWTQIEHRDAFNALVAAFLRRPEAG